MKKGFTIIELLVVIAIIGMISSFVIYEISGAVKKGQDAKIRSQLSNFKVAAEVFYNATDDYGTYDMSGVTAASDLTYNPNFAGGFFASTSQAVGAPGKYLNEAVKVTRVFVQSCGNPTQSYAVAAYLLSDPTKVFCVDSENNTVEGVPTNGTCVCRVN